VNLGLLDSAGRVQVGDMIKEVSTKYPALAQVHQSAWTQIIKAFKKDDNSILHMRFVHMLECL